MDFETEGNMTVFIQCVYSLDNSTDHINIVLFDICLLCMVHSLISYDDHKNYTNILKIKCLPTKNLNSIEITLCTDLTVFERVVELEVIHT